jgi:hypothetical protein
MKNVQKLLLFVLLSNLVGCSTTPSAPQRYTTYQPQYCYSEQVVQLQGRNRVEASSTQHCSDSPGQQVAKQRAGIDKNCKEFWYTENRGNRLVDIRGVRCEKLDGTWEIIDINGYRN